MRAFSSHDEETNDYEIENEINGKTYKDRFLNYDNQYNCTLMIFYSIKLNRV